MGLWNRHRLRQAGKYSKAHYKLALMQCQNSPEVRANRAAWEARATGLKDQHKADRLMRQLRAKAWRLTQKQRVKALFGPKVPQQP